MVAEADGTMSGKIFKPDSFKREQKGARYKPGQPSLELNLAAKVAELYLSRKLMPWYTLHWDCSDRFDRSLEMLSTALKGHDIGALDHTLFLDMLMQRLGQDMDSSMTGTGYPYWSIDPLVQLLYLKGLNNFSINLLLLLSWPDCCGSYLRGESDRPLIASYIGDKVGQFAYDSRDSVLSLKADALNVGHTSVSVVVKFDGASGSVGWRGEGCDYEFLDEFAVINPYENHDCTFRVRSDTAYDGELGHLSEMGFFRRGNRILMPDGKGGWDEVIP